MIRWWKTELGQEEIAGVSKAITDRHISQGPVTRQFEEALAETLGVPYVVCTTSGTTALTMALLAAGVGPGSEVVVPNITWIATAHAVLMTGAKVKLLDVSPTYPLLFNVEHTNAVCLPVNLNGRLAKIPSGLVIEDSCQAFPQPPRGLASCYSLSVAKIITTGQGGFVATRDEGFYRELRLLRTHAIEDVMNPRPLTWERFGYNFRFTDLQASIGLAQLKKLPERIDHCKKIYDLYKRNLPSWLKLIEVPEPGVPIYIDVLYDQPEDLRAHLRFHEIESRPFHPPLHTAPYLNQPGPFPNSERYRNGLVLPCGPARSYQEVSQVLDVIHDFQ